MAKARLTADMILAALQSAGQTAAVANVQALIAENTETVSADVERDDKGAVTLAFVNVKSGDKSVRQAKMHLRGLSILNANFAFAVLLSLVNFLTASNQPKRAALLKAIEPVFRNPDGYMVEVKEKPAQPAEQNEQK